MTDKVVSQVRWYRKDGSYAHTTTVPHEDPGFDMSPLFGYESPGMLPVNPCNVMIRRNGKLVSYKEFQ